MKRYLLVLLFWLFALAGLNCSSGQVSLVSPDPDLRREAIIKLVASGNPQHIPHFIEMLQKDPDYLVRAQAAQALADLKATSAVSPLIKALEDANQWVRLDVAIALGRIGDLRATAPLIEILTNERFSGVRRAAARALAMLKDPTAIPGLTSRLEDIDQGVSEIAYQSLCEITGQKLPKDIKAWQEWYDKSRE